MATQEYKTLDQLRTRLSQLSASINLLRHELEATQPLPSWPSLQTASSNLAGNLQALAQALASQRTLLSSAHAYPNTNFPGLTQEAFLQQLLRKKMDPKAEDWMDRELDKQPELPEDRGELWDWAGGVVKEMRADLEEGLWGDYFTMEERKAGVKNVHTGIKRQLDVEGDEESGDGDEDDEDEVMGDDEAVGREESARKHVPDPLPLENLLKFASGTLPLPLNPNSRRRETRHNSSGTLVLERSS